MDDDRVFLIGQGKSNKQYGSIRYSPLVDEVYDPNRLQTRCIKRDCIAVSLLSVLAVAAMIVTLSVGLPAIRSKQFRLNHDPNSTPSEPAGPNLLTSSRKGKVSAVGLYNKAAVSSSVPECSQISRDILWRNGSAVDAAIAGALCLGVFAPHHCGIGGGFLMTIYNKSRNTGEVIDARETAPGAATEDMFDGDQQKSEIGGLAVAVPGSLQGYWTAHQRHGKLPWAELIEPTIAYAKNGHRVTRNLASALQLRRQTILNEPSLSEVLVDVKTGDVYRENDTMFQPQLAETLRQVADQGADVFYSGNIAKLLVEDIRKNGGNITSSDMLNYKPLVKPPIVTQLRNGKLTMYGVPPPGSGAVVAFILNILEGYRRYLCQYGGSEPRTLAVHRRVEAFKFAYAKRTFLGDEDFVNVKEIVQNLTSKEYAEEIRSLIYDEATYDQEYYGPNQELKEDHGTSHLSLVAPNGDAVSITTTINTQFGAKFHSRSTGVILNNHMNDFTSPKLTKNYGTAPHPTNYIWPGKRPMSSMAPTIVVNATGDVTLVSGAAGGLKITTATATVVYQVLLEGADLKESMSSLRVHHQLFPNVLDYEEGYPQDILAGLAQIGHSLNEVGYSSEQGVVNSIARLEDGRLYACSEPRLDSGTDGF